MVLGAVILLLIAAASVPVTAGAQSAPSDAIYQLVLSIYANQNGTDTSLITGYVSDPTGLPFLKSSDHIYENDTGKLYARTGDLINRTGMDTLLNFNTDGHYDNYHVTFYLPSDVSLISVNCPEALDYTTSASKDSLVVDVQGFDVDSPDVSMQYRTY